MQALDAYLFMYDLVCHSRKDTKTMCDGDV